MGLAPRRFSQKPFPDTIKRWELFCDFDDADQRYFRAVGHNLHPSLAHARSAHSEEMNVRSQTQSRREACRVHVSGGFAGGDKNLRGRHRFERERMT